MATIAEIKKTPLYRRLAPYIIKRDREEFARMLSLVPILHHFNADTRLDESFYWARTPQGYDYWAELNRRLEPAYIELGMGNR